MINNILNTLITGNVEAINYHNANIVNNRAMEILSIPDGNFSEKDLKDLKDILDISNILYNNTDRDILFLEDGVYDILIRKYAANNPTGSYPVGAIPVTFEASARDTNDIIKEQPLTNPILRIDRDIMSNSLYINNNNLLRVPDITVEDVIYNNDIGDTPYVSKRLKNTAHKYPKLVGTLDKCKFTLNIQAMERGVFNDGNVSVFERDFIQKHIQSGILDPNREFTMIAELKYDGISIEAEVTDEIITARTRGDTKNNLASDLTPIFKGYKFKHAIGKVNLDEPIGMKFEAVISKYNVERLAREQGINYVNPRTAIIGLTGSGYGRKYLDYITLVPLASSIGGIDRQTDIEFINKYYHSGEHLRYAVLRGNYQQILFQVNKFVQEAEYMRYILPYMYDGVVISYDDQDLVQILGRKNSVNQYSIAIKFNAMKKQTIFTGYDYTVGQNGVITPMIHYNPVEFYGSIHTKSSGHSLKRFYDLQLRVGDIIDVEYVDDVMPYVTKPDNKHNRENPNPIVRFIEYCPECGTRLMKSMSGKSIVCPNAHCKGRSLIRMANMLTKLGVKGFSVEYMKVINKYSLYDLFRLTVEDVKDLGETNSQKFISELNRLKEEPIYDYKIIGALGFTNIAVETWKLILNNMTLEDLLQSLDHNLYFKLVNIKGIGPMTATTIISERELFFPDLTYIQNMPNVVRSFGQVSLGRIIRFSGIRDKILCDKLKDMGHDADPNKSVTKNTDFLIIPHEGYSSTKTQKATKYGVKIVPYDSFVQNINMLLR